ncbi:MAG: DUF1573 domain-containing protein [Bacteroidales bacterium]|nr:DUF1573 domain-containing protein [Bacteroidales bacterium]
MKKFILLMISAVIILSACNNNASTKHHDAKSSVSVQDDKIAKPVMAFTETVHDFGNMDRGEIVKYRFHFKNVGNSDLKINRVQTTCGCTIGQYPHEAIPPGGEGDLDVTFNSTYKNGYQDKSVMIFANTQPQQTVLRITAFVKPSQNN